LEEHGKRRRREGPAQEYRVAKHPHLGDQRLADRQQDGKQQDFCQLAR
jgi:hypothetical protein